MKSISSLLPLVALIASAIAQQPNLGTAATFALVSAGGITNTGTSVVKGNVATTGHDVTGFPAGSISGETDTRNAAATQARADALAAFTDLHSRVGTPSTSPVSGQTFTPGTYNFASVLAINGDMTLSGNGTFVFTTGSTLMQAGTASIILANGATPNNVFFAVGSTATLGTGSAFSGSILSGSTISLNAGSTVDGGLYAGAAISVISSVISVPVAT